MAQSAFKKQYQPSASCLLDFYKVGHRTMYKEGITEVLINFTARSNKHSNLENVNHYYFAGIQHFINSILVKEWNNFFICDKETAVAPYKRLCEGGLGVPCDTSHLEALHDLGYLPLEVRALKEGSKVPYNVACITIRNTHPDFYWLPNFIETILSDEVWPIQTSLTTAVEYMKNILEFGKKDGTPDWLLSFLAHDFSMRGMMGGTLQGGAAISGIGHLMAGHCGSDNLPAGLLAEEDYGAYIGIDKPYSTIGSVPATEHSVQCSFSGDDTAYFRHCMKVNPTGLLSLVSDGYDFWKLITEVLPVLKDEIIARDGKLVIRPDSGDPVLVICGDESSEIPHIKNGLIETLWGMFGGTEVNGFKHLDSHIGSIYGDSITIERQREIYTRLHKKGFAIANVVLGIGSYSYQYVTRDTHGSAVKATNIVLNGVDTPIQKEVVGDSVKKSAKGRIKVIKVDNELKQIDQQSVDDVAMPDNQLEIVWVDGLWYRIQTLDEIREIVKTSL